MQTLLRQNSRVAPSSLQAAIDKESSARILNICHFHSGVSSYREPQNCVLIKARELCPPQISLQIRELHSHFREIRGFWGEYCSLVVITPLLGTLYTYLQKVNRTHTHSRG
jgi:hypothetical protein